MFKQNVDYARSPKMNIWRKVAINTWKPSTDASIYSRLTLNPEKALKYIYSMNMKNENQGHITITHFIGAVCGQVLKDFPFLNSAARGSKIELRKNQDIFFHASVVDRDGRENLSGHKIEKIDSMTLIEIASELNETNYKLKAGDDVTFKKSKSILELIPSFILRPFISLNTFIQYRLNIWSPLFGTKQDTFGSMMVTNIGTLGVEEAFVPFVPYSNTNVICSVGKITEEAVYREGEIRAGKVIKLCFTLDHRLVDGSTAAKVVKAFENYFENPEQIK